MHLISMKAWSEKTLRVRPNRRERVPISLWEENEFAVPVRRGRPGSGGGRRPEFLGRGPGSARGAAPLNNLGPMTTRKGPASRRGRPCA